MTEATNDDLRLTSEANAALNEWTENTGVTACPACRAEQWGRWRVYLLDTVISHPEAHYARACKHCGQLQLFRAAIVLPFDYSQFEEFNSFVRYLAGTTDS